MEAFAHAVDLGYRWIETDVHLTADGELVAFHDDILDRVTNRQGVVAEMTFAEISKARIAGTAEIPRFADLLSTFPDTRIAVDPKHDAAVLPLVRAIQQSHALDRVCVGSFFDERIEAATELLGPSLCTGLGPRGLSKLAAASVGTPVGRIAGGVAQIPVMYKGVRLANRRLVAEAHRRNLAVHVWTINEEDEMHTLLDLGVDGIMTDRPQLLKDVMATRDIWPTSP